MKEVSMDKEKEIEEVYDIIDDTIYIQYDWLYGKREAAENIVQAGYRKADEVRKEAAIKILRELWANAEFETLYDNDDGGYVRLGELEQVAEKYGVEVDE